MCTIRCSGHLGEGVSASGLVVSASGPEGAYPLQADITYWPDIPYWADIPDRHPLPISCWDTHPLPIACWNPPPPRGQNFWHTLVKLLPFRNYSYGR